MKKLWSFGCSNTQRYDDVDEWSKLYIKWKGYKPKVYVDFISENLNYESINLAKSGTNNYSIFQKICDSIESIKKNDLVIVQWTQYNRFRLSNKSNEWEDFYLNIGHFDDKLKNCDHITKDTIFEIFINRMNPIYETEIRSWEKIIKKSLPKNKIIFWNPFDDVGEHGRLVKSLETITMETKKEIIDPHFSENGHKTLSEILLKEKKDII
jgi:hypothetical protein